MTGERAGHAARFRAAARALAEPASADPAAMAFLKATGLVSAADAPIGDAATVRHHIAMLEFAATLERFFMMETPLAPGAFFCGATDAAADGSPAGNAAGRGFTLGQALLSCVGEAAEFRAMSQMGYDPRLASDSGAVPSVAGTSLTSGQSLAAPVERVLRAAGRAGPSSTGYAAGQTLQTAAGSALLECVERDAIARWWQGETMPAEIASGESVLGAIAQIRRPAARPVVFADMAPPDALAHAVVAVGSDAGGTAGLGTAFGFGSGFSLETACLSALLELCQGEIGLMMAGRKRREHGPEGLARREEEALARSAFYRVGEGLLAFRRRQDDPKRDKPADFSTAISIAADRGLAVACFDLTRPLDNIPVAKVLVDGLDDAAILESEPGRPRLL
ncbi:MAG: YcaO-like family protein [Rhizobiaceae bacterium]|nr:YcaO-like family protein [Rhizobiaceae bacterium]